MLLIRLISYLPLGFWYVISDLLYYPVYHLVRYRRNVVRDNLHQAFPTLTLTSRISIERDFYRKLCDQAVETVKTLTISPGELRKRVVIRNPEVVERFLSSGKSVIILISHQFNWEFLLHSAHVTFSAPLDFVYQELKSPFANTFMLEARTHTGGFAVKREDVARSSLKRRNILRTIGIVADQYPGKKSDKKYWIHFLGIETAFFTGPSQLANILQYPVVYLSIRQVRRGYYESNAELVGEPPFDRDSVEVIDRFARVLETAIKQHPANWLWSHKRWKRPRNRDNA